MYQLLIVDDEELLRQGLLARLEFWGFEFEGIFEACSGKEALEVTKKHAIDIVISDIQMPDMDGLTFITEAKGLYPNMKFILLSGYAEFAYAEKAIGLGVIAYLLKPLSNTELKETMNKAISMLDAEEKTKTMVSVSMELIKERSSYLLEKEVNAAVAGPATLEDSLGERYPLLWEQYPLAVGRGKTGGGMFFGILHIDSNSNHDNCFSKKDAQLLRASIKQVFYDIPSSCQKVIVNNLAHVNQLYVFFMMEHQKMLRDEVERIFLKIQSEFEKKIEIPLTLGMSRFTDQLSMKCKREAKEALKQKLLYGAANIYFYEDRKVLEAKQFPMAELTMMERYMERRDMEHMQKTIQKIFSEKLIVKYGANYIRIMWVRILNMVLHNFNNGMMEHEKGGIEEILSGFSLVDEVSSVQELANELDTMLLNCMQEDGVKDANAKNKVRLAIAYMEEHYNQNIIINELAERYGMSPNYFSSIFKKEMKQSAVNYLTKLRVDKAAQYLKDTGESVADISRRVGYEDSQYFFRVFKKATGVTPLMYRKEYQK